MSSVAYLGPRATFTESAARDLGHDPDVLVPCRDIGEVLRTVDRGDASHGVVPIENRLEGEESSSTDTTEATETAQAPTNEFAGDDSTGERFAPPAAGSA